MKIKLKVEHIRNEIVQFSHQTQISYFEGTAVENISQRHIQYVVDLNSSCPFVIAN